MKKLLGVLMLVCLAPVQANCQNIEGQLIASQYNYKITGYAPNAYSFPGGTCNASGPQKQFAFGVGAPITIVDGNPAMTESVTPSAVTDSNQTCAISIAPVNNHQLPWFIQSATGGLQEAINLNVATPAVNSIVLDSLWHTAVGANASTVIGAAQGTTKLNLVDVTTTPYSWYTWNTGASQYQLVSIGGGCTGNQCVLSLNTLTSNVTLQAGSNVTITPSGQNLTIAATSGTGTPGGPWNVTRYGSQTGTALPSPSPSLFQVDNTTTLAQLNALIASLNIGTGVPSAGGPFVGTGSIILPDSTPLQGWTNVTSNSGSGNVGVGIQDIRTGVQTTPLSQWGVTAGVQSPGCARTQGGWTFTLGSTTVSPSGNAFRASDVGNTIVVVGTVGGIPTRFMPTIASVNTGTGQATISTPAPFGGTYGGELGFMNSSNLQNAMTALGVGGLTGAIPAGCAVLTDTIAWNAGQSLIGQGSGSSTIMGIPGSDILLNPDTSGQSVTKDGLRFGHVTLRVDNSIDATKPWQNIDSAGNTTARTAMYRPLCTNGPCANNPLASGWALNATNGVASITNGSAVICVPTALGRMPIVGQQIVFRDTPTIFKSTISALSGSGCASGFSPATLAATASSTIAQAEWVSTSAVQALSVAIPAGSNTFPLTINVATSTSPVPGFESNVATHGRVKIGSEEYDYLGVGTNTLILRDGPSSTAGWPTGTAVVPENPCYADYHTPWPVVPTVNAGDSTPSGAVYYPGFCGGNAAISMPTANGNVYHGTGFSRALIQDVDVTTSGALNPLNSQCYYVAGNNASYSTVYDNLACENTTFGVTQGPASSGEHGVAAAAATGQGNVYTGLTLRGTSNMFLDDMEGSIVQIKDAYTTLYNQYDGTPVGAGTAFDFSTALDEQTGNGVSFTNFIHFNNLQSEPEIPAGATHAEQPVYLHSDCTSCPFTDSNAEGAFSVFGASYQLWDGGQLSLPIINYGSHNRFSATVQSQSGAVSNTWGTSSYLEWGSFSSMSPYASNGAGPIQNTGIGDREPYNGDNSDAAHTGNFQGSGFNPYGSSKAAYIAPEELGQINGALDSHPMSVGKTLDATELHAGSYSACNMTTSALCAVSHFGGGFNSSISIGNWDRIRPIAYDLAMNLETPAGASTFNVAVFAFGSSCPGQLLNQTVTTSTTWNTFHFPVNFATASGCTLTLQLGPTGSGSATVRVGSTVFMPTPGWVNLASQTLTTGAACPVPGPLLGSDNSAIYYCGADKTVHSSASGSGGGITALTVDVTASGSGTVAATVNSVGGGTPFVSQPAGPTCNSGATGKLGNCINGAFPGTVSNGVYTVPSSAASVFDITQANSQVLTLAQNTTTSLTAGSVGGFWVTFKIIQNSTGGWTFAWPSNFFGFPPVTTTAGQYTFAAGWFDGTNVIADGYGSQLCQSGANPAVCGTAFKGLVAIPPGTNSTLVVNTTALGANSIVLFGGDESASVPGITCGTDYPGQLTTTARNAGVGFTVVAPGTLTGYYCTEYVIINP